MTRKLMLQHIGAARWHFERAAEEAPSDRALAPFIHTILSQDLDAFGIDAGHVSEQGLRNFHLVPSDEVKER